MNADPLNDDDFEDEDEGEGDFEVSKKKAKPADDDPDTDNVGDPSVEINVEELIRELEGDGISMQLGNEKQAKRRLEEIMEQKRALRELEDFDDYDL